MLESKDSLKPLFKYPGGKTSEYKYLKDFFPDFHTYIEPFVGGGAVYWKTDAESWIINDFSEELINIYKYTQKQNALFLEYMESIAKIWDNKWILMRQVSDAISLNLSNESFDADLLTFSNVLDRHSSTIFSLQDMDVSLRKAFSQKIKSLERISTYKKIENIDENALGVI
ncbi:DNA adenine methylase, partial [Weissella viridescens]|uniref:DNA adenine methylase n=1 Tax=Weissella viridescens TaxID=1629 RepID=UPI003AA8DFDA